MRRREFYSQGMYDMERVSKVVWIAMWVVAVLAMLLIGYGVWGSSCNGDVPILCGCSKVSLRAEPCGKDSAGPSHWEVTVDHRERMLLQNMAIVGEEGMWIPLGDHYRLHPGDNLIEFRAVRAGYVAGPTESVVLTMSAEETPPEMGAFTITEVRGEGN